MPMAGIKSKYQWNMLYIILPIIHPIKIVPLSPILKNVNSGKIVTEDL